MEGRRLWARTLIVFVLSLTLFGLLYRSSPLIYDADSYYHLAVARGYQEGRISSQLPWVRFGLLAHHFGDKEILFHWLLVPFASAMDPMLGGRIALALLDAVLLAVIGFLALRAIGVWGLIVPFWLVLGSMQLAWRMVRLRPELLAVTLVLLALWAAVRHRHLLLGLIGFVFAISYTAVHAFVGLFMLVFLARAWAFRRWHWPTLLAPLLGAMLGLIVHPQFPENLVVWWFQSVEFLRFKGQLDVGTEILPLRTDLTLIANLGWFLGLLVWWRAGREADPNRDADAPLVFGVAALAFGLLSLLMSRFAVYSVPLVSLWVLFGLGRRGRGLDGWMRLPWRGRLRLGTAWALCFVLALPIAGYELRRYRHRNSPGPEQARLLDRQELARLLPPGARVAATWRSTPILMFWAPQGRYLNVLDPVFLAAADPVTHRAQEDLFSGIDNDPTLTAVTALDSEFIAYSAATVKPLLDRRLRGDPRAELLHDRSNVLFRLRPPADSPFFLDWRVVPSGSSLPPAGDSDSRAWAEYPRPGEPRAQPMEGFIDARRVAGEGQCVALVHQLRPMGDRPLILELAPAGSSVLWLDDEVRVQLPHASGAVLGEGVLLPLPPADGSRRITVLTCPDPTTGRSGFYLLRRRGSL